MKARLPRKASMKKAATTRSAFLADCSSSSRPGLGGGGPSSEAIRCRSPAGGGVPITRLGARSSPPSVLSPVAMGSLEPSMSLLSVMLLLQLLGLPGSDPHRGEDEQAHADRPSREALGHRSA